MTSERSDAIRRYVRGIGSLKELGAVGIEVTQPAPRLVLHQSYFEVPVAIPLADVAEGVVRSLASAASPATWAAVVLAADVIVTDVDTVDGQILLGALWDMAFEHTISPAAANTLNRLAAK